MTNPPLKPCRIITSLDLKGGVGKTHVCWLIAGVCEEVGKRCLVVDLDKQGNITTSLLPEFATGNGSDAFFNPAIDANISELIHKTTFPQIDVIPGGLALERYNLTDPTKWESSGLLLSLVDSLTAVRPFYDYILLDCPADISLITCAALCASDFLLIPLEAAQWGALGTQHVVKTYHHVRERHNARLQLLGFIVSRFKTPRKYQAAYLERLKERFGTDAFETIIPDLASFEQSVTDRMPVVLHSPRSHAASIARQFFRELESRSERLTELRQSSGGRRVRQPVVTHA